MQNSPAAMTDSGARDLLLTHALGAGAVQVTLNRPEVFNALSLALLEALEAELLRLAGDAAVRAVVLAGAGRAFCAGHHFGELLANNSLEFYRTLFNQSSRVMLAIQHMPQPVIARVHGVATAAGCQLVGACDLAVASADARFATSGIGYGAFCATPAVAVSRNVGRKHAMEMLLTGDFIDAATARDYGLVNRVVPAEQLDAEIAVLCASLAAKPAEALALGKQLFYRQLEMGIEAAYPLAAHSMACNFAADYAQEGLRAFTEKRAPSWKSQG